ncbi:hypothetical protein CHARACLAT_007630 [Characodon lateralis]|uniref:Uncharacterized protein n=1 Tax=Characodon lateralis TaxID=208331 RepID=A0ABU7EH64_9TELE|nr:hypothetical protein [Characodon lateralis]
MDTFDSRSPACPLSNTGYLNTAELPRKHTARTKESHHSIPHSLPTSATVEKTFSPQQVSSIVILAILIPQADPVRALINFNPCFLNKL